MSSDGLTAKQRKFVLRYLANGFHGTEAAVNAGYSQRSASAQATVLLKNPKVQAEIARLMEEYAMPTAEVLARLARLARSSIDVILDDNGRVDLKKARDAGAADLIKRVTVKRRLNSRREMVEITTVEMYDSQAALGLIAKQLGLLRESSVNLTITPDELAQMSEEELRDLQRKL